MIESTSESTGELDVILIVVVLSLASLLSVEITVETLGTDVILFDDFVDNVIVDSIEDAVDKIVDDEIDDLVDEMIIDFVDDLIEDMVVVEDVDAVEEMVVVEDDKVVEKEVPSAVEVVDGLVGDNDEVDFIANIGVVVVVDVVVDVVRVLSLILSVIVGVCVTILLALELKMSASSIESVDAVDIDSVEVGLLTVSDVFVLISK